VECLDSPVRDVTILIVLLLYTTPACFSTFTMVATLIACTVVVTYIVGSFIKNVFLKCLLTSLVIFLHCCSSAMLCDEWSMQKSHNCHLCITDYWGAHSDSIFYVDSIVIIVLLKMKQTSRIGWVKDRGGRTWLCATYFNTIM